MTSALLHCPIRGPLTAHALAESFNGLYKAELIHRQPWRGLDDVEYETLEYVDWFNHRRLHGEIGINPRRQPESKNPTPPKSGHPRVSMKPGAVQGVTTLAARAASLLQPGTPQT